jgi:hypothetical protein
LDFFLIFFWIFFGFFWIFFGFFKYFFLVVSMSVGVLFLKFQIFVIDAMEQWGRL